MCTRFGARLRATQARYLGQAFSRFALYRDTRGISFIKRDAVARKDRDRGSFSDIVFLSFFPSYASSFFILSSGHVVASRFNIRRPLIIGKLCNRVIITV